MKFIKLFILCLAFKSVNAQKSLPDNDEPIYLNDTLIAKPGEFYIDNFKVDLAKTHYYLLNTEDVICKKGESAKIFSGARSACLIKRKNNYEFKLLDSLIEEVKKEKNISEKFDVFIDNKKIEDIENVLIEISPNLEMEIINYSKTGVYHGTKPNSQIRLYLNEKKKKK
ncbi:hypothetical protein [Moheibacter stercoris]|uniref:Uncharacterized protein n=1 Tax=Moheibacter stercoris TaxID=1628251 RepID=A0ABV2LTU3_9FLAO